VKQGNIKLKNTVDLNNNNNRQKTESQPVHGFTPFFNTISKNNMLSDNTEMRYQQMGIVTNPVSSKHMGDENWFDRTYGRGGEHTSHNSKHGGTTYLCRNVNKRKRYGTRDVKGPPMTAIQKKLWAPYSYFVMSIAGNSVALSNKLGVWEIPVNYASQSIIDMCYSRVCKSFKTFLDSTDQGNTPRYLDVAICHSISHMVLKKVYHMLRVCETLESARLSSIQSLICNGLHFSQIAPMLHDFVARITPYPVLIILTSIINTVPVPILSLVSVLELLHGNKISNQHEAELLGTFLRNAIAENMFLPKHPTMDGRASPSSNITPYISAPFNNEDRIEDCPLRCLASQADNTSADSVAHKNIAGKILQKYKAVLSKCASINDLGMMIKLLSSVKGHEYDLSDIFGYTHMHNSKQLMLNATGSSMAGMPENFDSGAECDKMFVIRRVNATQSEYALGVRVWDALLFVALMKRPRMDFGIVNDFAESIVTHLLTLLPVSVMPYQYIPAQHYDSLESCPSQGFFKVGNIGGEVDESHSQDLPEFWCKRPEQILRNENTVDFRRNTKFEYQSPGPTKMLEDDAFMSSIITLQQHLHVQNFWDIPIHKWEFDIAWDWNLTYPVMLYASGSKPSSGVCMCMTSNKSSRIISISVTQVVDDPSFDDDQSDNDGSDDIPLPFKSGKACIKVLDECEFGLNGSKNVWKDPEFKIELPTWSHVFRKIAGV
jgi:hypothetical protein